MRGQLTDEQRRTGSHLSRGFRDRVRRHEERHQRVALALGAGFHWEFDDPRTGAAARFEILRCERLEPVQMAAIFYAGDTGGWGDDVGCGSHDKRKAARWINRYPRAERKAREAEARELARRHQ